MQKEELQCGKRDKNNDVSPFEKKRRSKLEQKYNRIKPQ